jgi:hypothetical protein
MPLLAKTANMRGTKVQLNILSQNFCFPSFPSHKFLLHCNSTPYKVTAVDDTTSRNNVNAAIIRNYTEMDLRVVTGG